MKANQKKYPEILFLSFLLIFFLFILIGAFQFPKDAKMFPILLSAPCIVIALYLIVKGLLEKSEDGKVKEKTKKQFRDIFPFFFSIFYFIAVYLIGYNIATLIVLVLVPPYLGYKKKKAIIISTVLVYVIVIGFFNTFLSLPYYKGLLGLI